LSLKGFVGSIGRLIKLIRKPTRDDFAMSIKITILGVGILGIIGFLIKFMSSILLAAKTTA
jgi:protein translocase SEC61 complex gamma subunit